MTTIVGLIGTASFASDINFDQGSGITSSVTFTQTGSGSKIDVDVVGDLATLSILQSGSTKAKKTLISSILRLLRQ